jgi:hypothetical protein
MKLKYILPLILFSMQASAADLTANINGINPPIKNTNPPIKNNGAFKKIPH